MLWGHLMAYEEDERIQWFIDIGNYHASVNLTISAMNACRRQSDHAGTDHYLQLLQRIVDTMYGAYGSQKLKSNK